MKKQLFKTFFIVAVLSTIAGQAVAQEAQAIEDRLAKVEKIISKLPSISGLVNTRFQYDSESEISKFDVRRARLDVKGNLSSQFDYRIYFDISNSPKLLDAYLRWKPASYFNLQVGQFKLPLTLENPYNPATLETIENSIVITKLAGYSDEARVGANGRDIGLAVSGTLFPQVEGYNLLTYYAGLFNGNGINNTDNNKEKDFSGIVSVNPVKEVTLALSHYNGYVTGTITGARTRTGFGARYDDGKLLARGEYLFGKTHLTEHEGFYLTAAYFVSPQWQPVVKFDQYDGNKAADNWQRYYTVGVNYFPIKPLKLQLNYTYRTENGKDDVSYVAAQAIVSF